MGIAPRRKRPRVVMKQEEGKLLTPARSSVPTIVSSVSPSIAKTKQEPSVERSQIVSTDAASVSSDLPKGKDSTHSMRSHLPNSEDIRSEHEGMDQSEPKVTPREVAECNVDTGDQQSVCSDTIKILSNVKQTETAESNPLIKPDLPNRYVTSTSISLKTGVYFS